MTDPCKRHTKRRVTAFRVVCTEDRKHFAVGEQRECVKCGDIVVRIATVKAFGRLLGKSAREALHNYGCTTDEIDAYMARHHPEEAARERMAAQPVVPLQPGTALGDLQHPPLSCWPFPISTVYNQDGTLKVKD